MIKQILIVTGVLLSFAAISQSTNPAPYCNTVNNATMQGEYSAITNVQLGALNNTTGFAEGGSRYHYYNNLGPATITIGVQQVLSISFGASQFFEPGYFACYIDANSDNTFSAGEMVFCNTLANGGILTGAAQTRTVAFTITAAPLGTYRMRVIRGESPANSPFFSPNFTLAACPVTNPNFWLGEVEDYDLLVTAAPVPVANFNLGAPPQVCVGQNIPTFNYSTNNPVSYNWSMPGASVVSSTMQTPTFSYSAPGNYTVTLVASNAGGPSAPFSRTITVLPSPTITIANAVANNNASGILCRGRTATLTASGATSYTWSTNATTSVIVVSPTVTTNYTVNATGQGGCKSTAVKTQSVSLCTGFNELALNGAEVKVFPNPSNGIFKISIANVSDRSELHVYDALGKLVLTQKAEEENSITLEAYSNGVYFLKVTHEGALLETKLLIKN